MPLTITISGKGVSFESLETSTQDQKAIEQRIKEQLEKAIKDLQNNPLTNVSEIVQKNIQKIIESSESILNKYYQLADPQLTSLRGLVAKENEILECINSFYDSYNHRTQQLALRYHDSMLAKTQELNTLRCKHTNFNQLKALEALNQRILQFTSQLAKIDRVNASEGLDLYTKLFNAMKKSIEVCQTFNATVEEWEQLEAALYKRMLARQLELQEKIKESNRKIQAENAQYPHPSQVGAVVNGNVRLPVIAPDTDSSSPSSSSTKKSHRAEDFAGRRIKIGAFTDLSNNLKQTGSSQDIQTEEHMAQDLIKPPTSCCTIM